MYKQTVAMGTVVISDSWGQFLCKIIDILVSSRVISDIMYSESVRGFISQHWPARCTLSLTFTAVTADNAVPTDGAVAEV